MSTAPLTTARLVPLTLVPTRRHEQRRRGGRSADPRALVPRVAPRLRAAKVRRERREAEQYLARCKQLRADLIACISHELRTPLTSVIGYTEVLLCGAAGELTERQREMLERVGSNGDRLHGLIEGLLCAATARLEGGGPVDLADVFHEVVQQCESFATSRAGVPHATPAP